MTKTKVIAAKFKGLSVLSAALKGRDAVRPERAETTVQNYNKIRNAAINSGKNFIPMRLVVIIICSFVVAITYNFYAAKIYIISIRISKLRLGNVQRSVSVEIQQNSVTGML